jgi:LacI family transcriptional regulator
LLPATITKNGNSGVVQKMSHVTLKDIAKEMGVSITTISRALNNKNDISPLTKERILRVIKQRGYTLNAVARGLKIKRTETIGIVITDISDPFFAPVVKGVEKTAQQEGYHVILCDTDEDYQIEKEAIRTLIEKRVDGLLITPTQTNYQDIVELKRKKLPFVLLARHFDFELLETNYVSTDDVKGAFSVTTFLIEKGHGRILFVNGPSYISSAKERLAGYKRALLEAGVEIDESLIRGGGIKKEDGYRIMKEELEKSSRFTAVFAYSDFVALGIIEALKEANYKIPQDIAVVGYDDIDIGSFLEAPLTTMRIPKYDLGVEGFKLLKKRMAGEVGSSQKVILPTELIVRKSA